MLTLPVACSSTALTGFNAYYERNQLSARWSNFRLTHQLKRVFAAHPELKSDRIKLTTFQKTILLTGQSQTKHSRHLAETIIRQHTHHHRIINLLTIAKAIPFSQRARDLWITAKLKAKFIATNQLNPSRLTVSTDNATVYLLGIVRKNQAQIAEYLAQHTQGVKKVVSIFEYIKAQPIRRVSVQQRKEKTT